MLQLSDRGRGMEREEKKTRENGKYYCPQTEKPQYRERKATAQNRQSIGREAQTGRRRR